jgi:lysozyme
MASLLPGVDVSSFQGTPGQWHAEAGRIAWAAVKLTEIAPDPLGGVSRYVSPDAAADWQALGAAGLVRIAYLFAHPAISPADTAALFLSELDRIGYTTGDGIAIDLETSDGRPAAQVASWAADLAGRLEAALARRPVLYTYLSFAQEGNCTGLGHLPLWISDPSSPAGRPRVPAPWTGWALHQYSIDGPIDRDVAAAPSPAVLRALIGCAPPDPEDDMPNGILLTTGPTPIRGCANGPWNQLLLSCTPDVSDTAPVKVIVSILDGKGVDTQTAELAWRTPAVVHFRDPATTKALSVERTDTGTSPVAWMLV